MVIENGFTTLEDCSETLGVVFVQYQSIIVEDAVESEQAQGKKP